MNAFLVLSGITPASFGSGSRSAAQRESLVKKAALTFDVNPIVVRIRLDSLFNPKKI
jgi:hypothetical protein